MFRFSLQVFSLFMYRVFFHLIPIDPIYCKCTKECKDSNEVGIGADQIYLPAFTVERVEQFHATVYVFQEEVHEALRKSINTLLKKY